MKPFYQDEYATIYNADCLNVLPHLMQNQAKFDAVITDPPFGTVDGKGKVTKKNTTHVPFDPGDWDKELPLDWIPLATDILELGAWILAFTDKKETTTLWRAFEAAGIRPKHTFYWVKKNWTPMPRKNFASAVETAVVGTKGAIGKWNGGGWTPNFFQASFVSTNRVHPTQKPLQLMSHLVQLLSDPKDVILDPFMGSGTTLLAAKQNGRRCVGIEINEQYCECAAERLMQEVMSFKPILSSGDRKMKIAQKRHSKSDQLALFNTVLMLPK
jgi:site-specific DNA-methyltransferase (adenine-specific)